MKSDTSVNMTPPKCQMLEYFLKMEIIDFLNSNQLESIYIFLWLGDGR